MSAYEYDFEPIRGLPGHLPEGEKILWQGSPDWATFAVHALHVRLVTLYFAAIVIGQPLIVALGGGDRLALARAAGDSAWTAALGLVAIGLLCAFAVAVARTSVYTITNRRVVLRIGVAVAKAVNLPFSRIVSAALRTHAGGAGDIPLHMSPDTAASYILLWPHARPFASQTEPMMRAVPDAQAVSSILVAALQNASAERDIRADGDVSPALKTTSADQPRASVASTSAEVAVG